MGNKEIENWSSSPTAHEFVPSEIGTYREFGVMPSDNVWITSDTHFHHRNIIKYESLHRPFATIDEHDEELIRRWNSVVYPKDVVFHLGDFAFAGKTRIKEYVSRLNGRIHLLLGNHDRDVSNLVEEATSLGFDGATDGFIILDGKFILSHEPIVTNLIPDGYVNLYGHVHGHLQFADRECNRACMCVERNNCTPFDYHTVKGWYC